MYSAAVDFITQGICNVDAAASDNTVSARNRTNNSVRVSEELMEQPMGIAD